MYRFILLITFSFIIQLDGNAQILSINQPLFSDMPFFNTEFIHSNHIKSITGEISSKKKRDIIRPNNQEYHYEFTNDGKLKSQLSSYFSKGLKDSSIVSYSYFSNGNISIKRKSDSYGYFSYHYNYDDFNNIITQTYCRDKNKYESKNKFDLKKEYIIITDSFSYTKLNDRQTEKIFYNSYSKKYKIQTNYYDDFGYLKEEYTKFIIGNSKKKLTYDYNENGRLFKKHTYSNIAQNKKSTEVYTYDKIGNVLDIKYYDTGKHITTKQFLYDKKTFLLSAIIIQDLETGFLRIIKYSYTFYEDSPNFTKNKNSIDSLEIPGSN